MVTFAMAGKHVSSIAMPTRHPTSMVFFMAFFLPRLSGVHASAGGRENQATLRRVVRALVRERHLQFPPIERSRQSPERVRLKVFTRLAEDFWRCSGPLLGGAAHERSHVRRRSQSIWRQGFQASGRPSLPVATVFRLLPLVAFDELSDDARTSGDA